MALTLAELNVLLTASTKGFSRDIEGALDKASKNVENFARSAQDAARKATLALAGLGAAAGYMVKVASDAEELDNVVRQSFGSMTGEIDQWSRKSGRAMGRTSYGMRKSAGTLQAMLKPMVGSTETAAEMSKSLAELAVDLGSFWNVADDDALVALRAGLVGETEPLRRFGIVLTEAQLQAFALDKGISKSVTTMSEAEKVTLRYQYILSRTTDVQGDAERTAGSFANQFKALQSDTLDLAMAYGELLLPVATELVKDVRELVQWFTDLDDSTKRQIVQWGAVAAAVLGAIVAFGLIVTAVSVAVKALAILGAVIGLVTSPWILAIGLLTVGIAAFLGAWDISWQDIAASAKSAWDEVGPILDSIKEWEKKALKTVWSWIVNGLDWVSTEFIPWLKSLPERIRNTWDWVVNGLDDLKDAALLAVARAVTWTVDLVKGIWQTVTDWIDKAVTWIVDLARGAWGAVTDWIDKAVTWVVNLAKGIWNTVGDWVDRAVTWVVDLAQGVWSTVKDWIDRAVTWVVNLSRGVWATVSNWIDRAVTWTVNLAQGIMGKVSEWVGAAITWLVDLAPGIMGRVSEWVDAVVTWIVNLARGAASAVRGWIDRAITWTVDLAQGLIDRVSEWIDRAVTWIVDLAQGAAERVSEWIDAAVTWTVNLARGVWTAVKDWVGATVTWLVDLAQGVVGKVSEWIGTAVTWTVDLIQGSAEKVASWVNKALEWTVRIVQVVANTASKAAQWFVGWLEGKAEAGNVVDVQVEVEPNETPGWGTNLANRINEMLSKVDPDLLQLGFDAVLNVATGAIAWTAGAFTVKAIEGGVVNAVAISKWFAGMLGGAVGVALSIAGTLTLALAGATAIAYLWGTDDVTKQELIKRIQEIWANDELTLHVKIGQIVLEILDTVWSSVYDQLDEKIFKPIRQIIGTEPTKETAIMHEYFLGSPEKQAQIVQELGAGLGETQLSSKPSWWQKFISRINRPPAEKQQLTLEALTGIKGIDQILDAIFRAEGGTNAEVPYGMLSFAENNRFGLDKNQKAFENLLGQLDVAEGSEEYYRVAAAVTVTHYWETFKKKFPEIGEQTFADLAPEMQKLFINHLGLGYADPNLHPLNANWIPNVSTILGLHQVGGYTLAGADSDVAGVVHANEWVAPAWMLRQYPELFAALETGRKNKGFQAGGYTSVSTGNTELDRQLAQTGNWMDSLNKGLDSMVQTITGAFSNFFIWLGEFLIGLAKQFFPEQAEALEKLLADMKAKLEGYWNLLTKSQEIIRPRGGRLVEEAEVGAEIIKPLTWMQQQIAAINKAIGELNWAQTINSALDTISNGLQEAGTWFAHFMGDIVSQVKVALDDTGRIMIDWGNTLQSMLSSAINTILNSLMNLIFGDYGAEYRGMTAEGKETFPDLTDMVKNYHDWDANLKELQDLQRQIDTNTVVGGGIGAGIGWLIGGPIGAIIGLFLGSQAANQASKASYADEIAELQEKLGDTLQKIKETLGTSLTDMADSLAGAFNAETYEDFIAQFTQSLEDRTKQALIMAFMSTEPMREMLANLSDAITAAVLDNTLSAEERETITGLYQQITDQSSTFYNALQDLGIATESTASQMGALSETLRNVPSGFKIALERFRAAIPVDSVTPALASGGIVTRPTDALVGEAGPEAVIPLNQLDTGGDRYVFDFRGAHIYGMDDFEGRIEDAMDRIETKRSLRNYGTRGRR